MSDSNVQSLPFKNDDFLRLALQGLQAYLDRLTPQAPDPFAQDKQLFDQVVMMRLAVTGSPEEAIKDALLIVKARRELAGA